MLLSTLKMNDTQELTKYPIIILFLNFVYNINNINKYLKFIIFQKLIPMIKPTTTLAQGYQEHKSCNQKRGLFKKCKLKSNTKSSGITDDDSNNN